MSPTPTRIIGVAGAPHVARALREIGYTVVTGPTFRDAAVAIAKQLSQTRIPVVVETMTAPGFTPWVAATNAKSDGVLLLPTDPSIDLTGQLANVPRLNLPATVGDLIGALGHQAVLHDAADVIISVAGADDASPAPALATTSAPARVDSPAPAPVPQTAAPQFEAAQPVADPFQAPATPVVAAPFLPAPHEVSDPFVQPAAAPVSDPFVEMPAPVTDPFGAAGETPSTASPQIADPFVGSAPVPEDDFLAMMRGSGPVPSPDVQVAAPVAAPVVHTEAPLAPTATTPTVEDDFLALMNDVTLPVQPQPVEAVPAVPDVQPDPSDDDFVAMMRDYSPQPVAEHVAPAPVAGAATPASQVEGDFAATMRAESVPAAPTQVSAPATHQWTPEPAAATEAWTPEPVRPVVEQPHTATPQTRAEQRARVAQAAPVHPAYDTRQGSAFETPAPAPAHVVNHAADFFGGSISTGGAKVIFSTAGKGGAGKTTMTLLYAQTAGAAGMRVLVIDANRDQGDIGSSLRIEHAGFHTVLEALHGSPERAVVRKEQINERGIRPAGSQAIEFDVVLAPPRELAGPNYASAAVYGRVLDWAKSHYDVIVVDTQIIEAEKSDIHLGLTIPELRAGAWNAGIAQYDYSALKNAFAVFEELSKLGVNANRSLVVATEWPEREGEAEKFNERFGHFGTFMGFVATDPNLHAQKSVGNLLVGSPAVAPVVRAVLHRVTGRSEFAPIPVEQKRKRRGLFGGRR